MIQQGVTGYIFPGEENFFTLVGRRNIMSNTALIVCFALCPRGRFNESRAYIPFNTLLEEVL